MASLQSQKDFLSLKQHGTFIHANHWLAASFKKNDQGQMRWAWTISKKNGNAVMRNRLKRWGREFVGELDKNELDINFIFKNKGRDFYRELTHKELDEAFEKLFRKIS